tara:strand:+ start:319 stop:501 length:183 start_codon:yes stop_codon:yes gene_type:complete
LFGYSVSIFEDVLAIGCPAKRQAIPEIQVLKVLGDIAPGADVSEVQIINTEVSHIYNREP